MSDIAKAVEEYLSTRRALGFQLNFAALMLRDFARFVAAQHSAHITAELAVTWACKPVHAQPCQWSKRLGAIRCFARSHSASDPLTEIPVKALLPFPYIRKDPYIYTQSDIAALTKAAGELPCRRGIIAAAGVCTGCAMPLPWGPCCAGTVTEPRSHAPLANGYESTSAATTTLFSPPPAARL